MSEYLIMKRNFLSIFNRGVIRPTRECLFNVGLISSASLLEMSIPESLKHIYREEFTLPNITHKDIFINQIDKGPSKIDLEIFEKHFNFLKKLEEERNERIENFWKEQKEETERMFDSLKPNISFDFFQPKYNQETFKQTWGMNESNIKYGKMNETLTSEFLKPQISQNLFEIKLSENLIPNNKPELYEITVSHIHKSKAHNYLHVDTYLQPVLEDGSLGKPIARKDGIKLENLNPYAEYKWNVPGLMEGKSTILDFLKSKKYEFEEDK